MVPASSLNKHKKWKTEENEEKDRIFECRFQIFPQTFHRSEIKRSRSRSSYIPGSSLSILLLSDTPPCLCSEKGLIKSTSGYADGDPTLSKLVCSKVTLQSFIFIKHACHTITRCQNSLALPCSRNKFSNISGMHRKMKIIQKPRKKHEK